MALDHIQQAAANLAVANKLGLRNVADRQWVCTIAFYSSTHSIRHAASTQGRPPSPSLRKDSHAWDAAWMAKNARDRFSAYRDLRRLSEACRYRLHRAAKADAQKALSVAQDFYNLSQRGELPRALRPSPPPR